MQFKRSVLSLLKQVLHPPKKEQEVKDDFTMDRLIWNHFVEFSHPDHVNRAGLTLALRRMNNLPALIVETGSSAWGTNSSQLFDSYVKTFGGQFWTVDIREEATKNLDQRLSDKSTAVTGDSVSFLEQFSLPSAFQKIDLLYLDSYDLDIENPEDSMQHGLREFRAAEKFLSSGSIVVIDDTPVDISLLDKKARPFFRDQGFPPGKGALVLANLDYGKYKVLYHHYNMVLQHL